ncbi:hypothetical protein PENTCL1PPCAC_13604 [Pristionchus entomophagus]|uniref:Uncharacterized protein n=1 Tax=Pristionchus entomophagus TaxID=358040 RepID=A0AAV5T7Y7_9BILA|nr:hypothetical protein PENTCL1PPCAC_13604 [Pristionchus entomophagus]
MDVLPTCTYRMRISFLSDSEKLNFLPPMANLKLFQGCAQISNELLFKLLATHKNMFLTCESVKISSQEWKRIMQIISDDRRVREVQLSASHSLIKSWLLNLGIN